VPIIALTANAIVGNEDMFLNSGFQDFLSKPIDILRLDEVVNRWLHDKNQETETEEDPLLPSQNGPLKKLNLENYHIEGLDLKSGLNRFGGEEDTYLEVLKSYALNTPSLLDILSSTATSEELPTYAITVHGIKGSSHSIGAEPVRFKALELEKAAKGQNLPFVLENSPTFIEETTKLISSISKMISDFDQLHVKPTKEAPDQASLKEILEASRNFDIDGVEKAMTELEKYNYQAGGEIVVWLRSQIEIMAFKKICEGLENEITENNLK
jgi:HPt (histidine-containing phosphotransfer) domain-containing protein